MNECLYRGPVILKDLCALLLRFRTQKISVVADIEKAFHQVGLKETDRDVTRFLWLKDVSKPITDKNLEIFRFTRIPFGVISSPFILGSTIRHHLQRENNPVADKLAKDLYVDNLITGGNTEEEVSQIYNYAKRTFQEMSMNLREWGSNSSTLQQVFKEEDKYKGNKMKVLGLAWTLEKDEISLGGKRLTNSEVYTKRQILKETATVFDPLGFFTPVTLNAKLLLKDLWLNELG